MKRFLLFWVITPFYSYSSEIIYINEQIVQEKEGNKKVAIPNITKLFVFLDLLETTKSAGINYKDFENIKIPISEKAWRLKGKRSFLDPLKTYSLSNVLMGMGTHLSNDASMAIAQYISKENYLAHINKTLKEKGYLNTNISSLSKNKLNTSTAKDVYSLYRYLTSHYPNEMHKYFGNFSWEINHIKQHNKLSLVKFKEISSGLKGEKETALQWHKNNLTIGVINIGDKLNNKILTRKLYSTLKSFKKYNLVEADDTLGVIPILFSKKKKYKVNLGRSIDAYLKKGDNVEIKTTFYNFYLNNKKPTSQYIGDIKIFINSRLFYEKKITAKYDEPKFSFSDYLYSIYNNRNQKRIFIINLKV